MVKRSFHAVRGIDEIGPVCRTLGCFIVPRSRLLDAAECHHHLSTLLLKADVREITLDATAGEPLLYFEAPISNNRSGHQAP